MSLNEKARPQRDRALLLSIGESGEVGVLGGDDDIITGQVGAVHIRNVAGGGGINCVAIPVEEGFGIVGGTVLGDEAIVGWPVITFEIIGCQ